MSLKTLALSHWKDQQPVAVTENVAKYLKNYHIIGIRFLYDCFRKSLKGAILNHEVGMNFPLQVTAFLNALHYKIKNTSPVIIVCPISNLLLWHYHLVNDAHFKTAVITQTTYRNIRDDNEIILVSIEHLKLIEEFDGNFFMVVVDEFDEIANKRVFKKLKGQFNIGLTNRNFIQNPSSKLFWTMLNWSNPGVLGKQGEFCGNYKICNTIAYDKWWHRLTWHFCENFRKPTEDELIAYNKSITEWSKFSKLQQISNVRKQTKREVKQGKRKVNDDVQKKIKLNSKRTRKISSSDSSTEIDGDKSANSNQKNSFDLAFDLKEENSSQDTIIYEQKGSQNDCLSKKSVSYDSSDILSLIVGETITPTVSSDSDDILSKITGITRNRNHRQSKNSESDDILSSIINSNPNESKLEPSKDILSSLFDFSDTTVPTRSSHLHTSKSDNILLKLLENDSNCTNKFEAACAVNASTSIHAMNDLKVDPKIRKEIMAELFSDDEGKDTLAELLGYDRPCVD